MAFQLAFPDQLDDKDETEDDTFQMSVPLTTPTGQRINTLALEIVDTEDEILTPVSASRINEASLKLKQNGVVVLRGVETNEDPEEFRRSILNAVQRHSGNRGVGRCSINGDDLLSEEVWLMFMSSLLEANGTLIIHELYKVTSIQIVSSRHLIFFSS